MSVNLQNYPVANSYAILSTTGISSSSTTIVNDGYYGNIDSSTEITGSYLSTGFPSGENNTDVNVAYQEIYNFFNEELLPLLNTLPQETLFSASQQTLTLLPEILYLSINDITWDTSTTLTFDAQGNTNAQFFIYIFGNFTMSDSTMTLSNGASASNIFWINVGNLNNFTNVPYVYGVIFANSLNFNTSTEIGGHLFVVSGTISFHGTTLVDASSAIVCFRKGTKIQTEYGECLIENLKVNDPITICGRIHNNNRHVVHHSDISFEPLLEIKHFTVPFPTSSSLPICIQANALGEDLPKENLYLSPGHRICMTDEMIVAKNLVNGSTITQNSLQEEIEYYHLSLNKHSVIIANGLLCESFKHIA